MGLGLRPGLGSNLEQEEQTLDGGCVLGPGVETPGLGSCCTHGGRGRARQTASREEWHGRVTDGRIDDCSPGGALLEFSDAGCPD